jgi:hypothetical protein
VLEQRALDRHLDLSWRWISVTTSRFDAIKARTRQRFIVMSARWMTGCKS